MILQSFYVSPVGKRKKYMVDYLCILILHVMKNVKHLLLAGIVLSGVTLAASPSLPDSAFIDEPTAPIVSGEVQKVTPPVTLNSAPDNTMSGEININIPFNPAEVEQPVQQVPPVSWVPDAPKNIHLNSATTVETGPALNVAIALMLSLLISGFIYARTKPHLK